MFFLCMQFLNETDKEIFVIQILFGAESGSYIS